MNNAEFLNELLEYQKGRYDLFCKYQSYAMDILREFHRICKKNKLDYYMFYGSLLGAYRDKGLIPWDLDIDVCIWAQDIPKLISCLQNDLGDDFYVVSQTDKDFPYYQMRVCKKGCDYRIHVDVFYMYGLPSDKNKVEKYVAKVANLFVMYSEKKPTLDIPVSRLKRYIWGVKKQGLKRIAHSLLTRGYLKNAITKSILKYDPEKSDKFSVLCEFKEVYDKKYLGTPKPFDMNGEEIMVPENIEALLECEYKNWREYLPIADRYAEVAHGIHVVEDIESKRNAK